MNSHEQRQGAKRERYNELAEKNRVKAERASKAAHAAVEHIPFGQPILVGHHSESKHRNAIKRMDSNMRKSIEASDKADYYADKAAGVGSNGISSDDPEAVKKLKEKLAGMVENQESMKKFNALWRKAGRPKPDDAEAWHAIGPQVGYSQALINELRLNLAKYPYEGQPFPSYSLQNGSANIKRVRDRIAALEKQAQEAEEALQERYSIGEVELYRNLEENRFQMFFNGKPSDAIRAALKSSGFRWSRYNGCWQSYLSGAWKGERIAQQIEKGELS